MVVVCWCGRSSRPRIFTDPRSAHFKTLKPLITLRSAQTDLPVCLAKQLKCLCKILPSFQQTFTRTICFSSSVIVSLSLIRWTACAHAQFSGCSSTINAHSETAQMALCFQNLTLGALSSCRALSMLVGALFKNFGLFLNIPRIMSRYWLLFLLLFLLLLVLSVLLAVPSPSPSIFMLRRGKALKKCWVFRDVTPWRLVNIDRLFRVR